MSKSGINYHVGLPRTLSVEPRAWVTNVDALLAWATTHIACEWCGVQGATYDDSLDVFLCPNRHVAIKAFVKKYGVPAKVNDYPEDD